MSFREQFDHWTSILTRVIAIGGFVIAVIAWLGGAIDETLNTRINRALNELIGQIRLDAVDYEPPKAMAFDQVHVAETAGMVSATLDYARLGSVRAEWASACGYVGPDRESLSEDNRAALATMLASASMQCRAGEGCGPSGSYLPFAGMSMPVQRGQSWIVTGCSGAAEEVTRVYFHALTAR